MPTADQDLIRLIDQRIQFSQEKTRAKGTCVTRDTTGPGASVLFDGSSIAMPVKVLGHVFLRPGFRCVLDKYGSDWIVTAGFSAFGLGEAHTVQFGPSGGTGGLTSSSYLDIQELTPLSFTKSYDNTAVRFGSTAQAYLNVGTDINRIRVGIRITGINTSVPFTAVDFDMNYIVLDINGEHFGNYLARRNTTMPAGDYTLQFRWKRTGGTGTLKSNQDDLWGLEVDEYVQSASPIL